jgi:uncharacterized DUF497 family protein
VSGHPEDAEWFEWDDPEMEKGNTSHLARHQIRWWEVEQVWTNGGRLVKNRNRTDEWLLVGRTDGGRTLTIVFDYDEIRRAIRAFTGWDSTAGEIARYLRAGGT